jgi:hypothetical protein
MTLRVVEQKHELNTVLELDTHVIVSPISLVVRSQFKTHNKWRFFYFLLDSLTMDCNCGITINIVFTLTGIVYFIQLCATDVNTEPGFMRLEGRKH